MNSFQLCIVFSILYSIATSPCTCIKADSYLAVVTSSGAYIENIDVASHTYVTSHDIHELCTKLATIQSKTFQNTK